VVALLLAGGFMEWVFWAMRESYIQSRLGHIQVAREGYFDRGGSDPFAYLLPGESPLLAAVEAMAGVEAVTPRLAFTGLASRGETTVSFLGEGVDPEREAAVSRQLTIERGENLAADDPQGVIVGAGLAENLAVAPGDTLVLLATTEAGSVTATEARVRGVFRTSTKAFDDTVLRVPIAMARGLLRVDGAHTWVVLLRETRLTDPVLADLRARLGDPGGPGLEARPWHELTDFYRKTVDLFTRQINVVRVIIAVIIVVSISNTLIMGVLERTAEIGTLMALGQRRAQVLRLFVQEGLLLGLVGASAGLGLGYLLAAGISSVGIPMPPPPGMEIGFIGEIRVTPGLAVGAFVLAVAATLVASLYPAWRASRLAIVDALRHAR
jgi:putative ABC transport system permease protein